jgi:NAD(P)H dehydrogenase (quinone)
MRTIRQSFRTLLAVLLTLGTVLTANTSSAAVQAGKTTQEKIVISGASGQLGELVVRELLARGVPARDLILVSRTPEKRDEFKKLGATTRFGDFTKPESLPAAYAGGTKLLLISIGLDAGPRPEAHKRSIDAAVAAGIKHIVYTSFIPLSKGDHTGLASDHYQTEEIIKQSGVAWTMLRNSVYMNTLMQQALKIMAEGKATVSASESRIGYVTREDCAAAAAAVLATKGHENKVYEITGPELIGTGEIAAAVREVTGKPIVDLISVNPNAPQARRNFGGPAYEVVSDDFVKLTGRPATSVRQMFEAQRDVLLGRKK